MSGISEVLRLGRNITLFPVIHGSGDYAVEVRRLMLTQQFDCLAVPLPPPSFASRVEEAVEQLPTVSVVLQKEQLTNFESGEGGDGGSPNARVTYVPIDSVSAGDRSAPNCSSGTHPPRLHRSGIRLLPTSHSSTSGPLCAQAGTDRQVCVSGPARDSAA